MDFVEISETGWKAIYNWGMMKHHIQEWKESMSSKGFSFLHSFTMFIKIWMSLKSSSS